jgi:uncharacterized protein YkwD
MNRPLFATVVLVVVAISAGAMAIISEPREDRSPSASAPVPASTTTSEPDFAALVASGVVGAVTEEEADLTEEALTRSTSTTSTTSTSTTTTTTTVATTTTAPRRGSSPAPASPPTTQPATTTTTTTQSSSAGYLSGAENDFASRINSYRGSSGKAALSRDGSLNSYARSWAKHMAGQGSLVHSNLGSLLPPWSTAGENLGQGGSVSAIFNALVDSSGHRANMLEDFTHMGIGVWQDSNGTLWTVHVFTR